MKLSIKVLLVFFSAMLTERLVIAQSITVDPFNAQSDILLADDNFATQKRLSSDVHTQSKKKVFVWQEADALGSANKNIRCSVYSESMTLISSFLVNATLTGDQLYPIVKVNQSDNSFIVAWSSWINNTNTNDVNKYDIYAKKINFSTIAADAASADVLINSNVVAGRQILPLLAIDYVKNEAIIAWIDQDGQDNNTPTVVDNGSYARRINLAGNTISLLSGVNQFLINVKTLSHQSILSIEISPLTRELYTVCQSLNYSNASTYDVIFRKFNRDVSGNFIGSPEITVNTTLVGNQMHPYLITNSITGNYIIGYSGEDGSGYGSYFKVYDKYGNTVKDETRINQSTTSNQLVPKGFWDENTNTFIFFYWYSESSMINLRYQIFNANYSYLGSEVAAESTNLQNYYAGVYNLAFDKAGKKVLLTYDQFNASSGSYSKCWFRQFSFSPPIDVSTSNTIDMNYVETQVLQVSGKKTEAELLTLSENSIITNRDYFDGLGRDKQKVTRKGSPLKKDIVQPIEYDQYGRVVKTYLPYSDNAADGSYKNNAIADQATFYNNNLSSNADRVVNDVNPYTLKVYDDSPLNVITKIYPQGAAWQTGSTDHSVRTILKTNVANEVRKWTFDYAALTANGASFYDANQLNVTQKTDEDNNKTYSYTNKTGQVILERKQDIVSNAFADTYYVFDDIGNIRFVISPQGTSLLSTVSYIVGYSGTFTDQWLTTYKYDARQRVVEKKIPGCLPEYYVYDNYDRVVLSQNGNQRPGNKWSYVKYDALNRIIQTGLYSHTSSLLQSDMQSLFTTSNTTSNTTFNESRKGSTTYGYSNVVWPTSLCEALTLNYYDDYDFNFDGIPDYNYSVQGLNEEAAVNTALKGLPTGGKVKVLGSSSDWLITASFYDKNYRPIQIQKNNHKNLTTLSDVTTNINDFIGKITYTKKIHNAGSNLITITNRLDYDHVGRPLKVWQKVNTDPEIVLSQVNYNELGQVVEKNLHSENSGSTFLQSLDFTYNIRGWLTELNNSTLGSVAPNNNNDVNDLFNMSLRYETPVGPGMTPRFNGRIAAQCWKGANAATSTSPVYITYDYNGLQNFFGSKVIVDPLTGEGNNNFKEDNITYYLNGNISTLDRTTAAGGYIDKLTYIYNGNKLIKITDASGSTQGFRDGVNTATEYTYDNNGNLLKDDNKGLSFIYGFYNNLPTTVLNGGLLNRTEYTYSADGTKLKMKTFINNQVVSTWDYIDNFIYKDNAIYKIGTAEGRMSPNGGTYTYEYDLKDHLGNVRMSFDKNPSSGVARIIQEDHYYPFGMQLSSNQYSYRLGTLNNMLFNGKEKMDDLSLGMYDYGARFYDPAIGRWIAPDPLADEFSSQSPYCAMDNNPINLNDPSGMDAASVLDVSSTMMEELTEKSNLFDNSIATCPTCPKGAEWDEARNSKDLYEYNKETNQAVLTAAPVTAQGGGGTNWDANFKSQMQQARVGEPNEHWLGPALLALASPTPKRFVAANSSQASSVLSNALSKAIPKKIQIGATRRLYTHTVNGSARYAATWGRFIGRWATRIANPLGHVLTAYDFTNMVAIPMGDGVADYTETYKDAGLIYHVK